VITDGELVGMIGSQEHLCPPPLQDHEEHEEHEDERPAEIDPKEQKPADVCPGEPPPKIRGFG